MGLDSDIRLLSRVRLFAGFEPDHLRLLAFGAEARALAKGTRLYRQDDLSDGGFVVVRGNVDLISGLNDGVISSHGTGSLIGEMALISETRHAATAIATENTEVLKITRPLFRRMLNEYPQLAVLLQQRIGEAVSEFAEKLDIVRAKLDHASDLASRKQPQSRS
ncbi:MAG: cyclic nucleotide-binding domain-containing protein [Rhizobiaceae bacterium]|nr:cyclic nucleotide-binding domain-containing protein [Hyphomicrobiales bacterium]NRB31848.1 cyclic nucleotide-binding domain-containing protein [Rhizobiaceae bacterium]